MQQWNPWGFHNNSDDYPDEQNAYNVYNPTNPFRPIHPTLRGLPPTSAAVSRPTPAKEQIKPWVFAEFKIIDRHVPISDSELREMLPCDPTLSRMYNTFPLYPMDKQWCMPRIGDLVWYTPNRGVSWHLSVVIKKANVVFRGGDIPSWWGHKLPRTCTCPFSLMTDPADALLIPAYGSAKPDSESTRQVLGHPELTAEGRAGLEMYDRLWRPNMQCAIRAYEALGEQNS